MIILPEYTQHYKLTKPLKTEKYLIDDVWGIVFFIFGFAMNQYLGLSTTAIIFPAIVIAYLYYRTIKGSSGKTTESGNEPASEEEII